MDVSCKMRVALLVYLDDSVEKIVDTLACPADGRHHRHSEKPAELTDIQLVSFSLKLIIHVQSHHDTQVHVDELRG